MLHRRLDSLGKYAPTGFDLLDKSITQCFLHAEGPGALPTRHRTSRKLLGVLSPYGVYDKIGYLSAWSYARVAESALPDIFVVIGQATAAEGFFTYLFSGWETPFGKVQSGKDRGQILLQLFPLLKHDAAAFSRADAIEAQLPFLQFVNKDALRELTILPLLVNSTDYDACQRLGEALGELGEQCHLSIIGSCNLTGDVVDPALVDALKTIDVKKIRDILSVRHASGELLVFAEAMKSLYARQGRLLAYRPGSASMVFER